MNIYYCTLKILAATESASHNCSSIVLIPHYYILKIKTALWVDGVVI